MHRFVANARSLEGYVDLDEEDAILDVRRLFGKRGVDPEAGERELKRLMSRSKVFFESAVVVVQDNGVDTKLNEPGLARDGGPDSDEDEDYQYIVALANRGRRSTLHRRGGCWRAKRLAFGSYELRAELPGEDLFDAKCRDCWRSAAPTGRCGSGCWGLVFGNGFVLFVRAGLVNYVF